MQTSLAELAQVRQLLALEKQADFTLFRERIQSLPLAERKAQGYCWHPLRVVKTGFAIGDKAYVLLERQADKDAPNQFRSGMQVSLFTQAAHVHHPSRSGVIQFMNESSMKVILHSSDLPDWLSAGSLGIDLDFDERSYLEMERALEEVSKARGNRLAELRDILLGNRPPDKPQNIEFEEIPALNPAQNRAVQAVLASRDVSVLHGPPGTGKTTTLVQAIRLLAARESQVLVTAPSNTAVDLLTERLAEAGMHPVRVGNISRVEESVLRHSLDYQLAHHPDTRHIKKVRIEAAEARRQLERLDSKHGYEVRERKKELRRELRDLQAWAAQMEDQLIERILFEADVITCTLVGSSNKVLEKLNFESLVIDEAAQGLEPATWIPILKAKKVVLAGDPLQLPPTVKSPAAQRQGLSVTLLEKALERLPEVYLLDTQYRMHEQIMGFSNAWFYQNKLLAHGAVAARRLFAAQRASVCFIDTAGCGFQEESLGEGDHFKSKFNPGEYFILREHWRELQDQLPEGLHPSLAIISPYRQQLIYIRQQVAVDEEWADRELSVSTIDGFQGQERDIIYISLVRSNDSGEIGFLQDYRRLNVALTRARQMLIVIGDSATIGQDPFYQAFIEYCEGLDAYRSAWDLMGSGAY